MKRSLLGVLLGLAIAAGPGLATPAAAQPAALSAPAREKAVAAQIARKSKGEFKTFYAERGNRPIWLEGGANAEALLRLVNQSAADGLDPAQYRADKLRAAIAKAGSGNPSAIAAAELELTKTFARLVQDMRRTRDVGYTYADPALAPKVPAALTVMRAATIRPFGDYLAAMGWMSPHYVEMRKLLLSTRDGGYPADMLATIRLNLERARHLPSPSVRHIVVDASSGRLWYYQAGQEVGEMKVVVGAEATQTPLLVGSLTWAIVNPYWNVPDYLVRDNVAKKIVGGRTLASMHMEVLSDWTADAKVLDPKTVDWHAVAGGAMPPRVRELPGPANSMGKVKFLFPNDKGIYLHDTPNTDLFKQDDRHVSNGCIRLEKAAVLGRWMMGGALDLKAKGTELAVPIPASVPVYLTYLTPVATDQGVGLRKDIYGLDLAAR